MLWGEQELAAMAGGLAAAVPGEHYWSWPGGTPSYVVRCRSHRFVVPFCTVQMLKAAFLFR